MLLTAIAVCPMGARRRGAFLVPPGVLMLLLLPACTGAPPVPPQPDAELTVVLAALKDDIDTTTREPVLLLRQLIAATADAADFEPWLDRLIPVPFQQRLPLDLLRHYWEVNRTPRRLTPLGDIGGRPVRLVRASDLPTSATMRSASRAALSPAGDSALVMLNFTCPGLCGSSRLWLYVRTAEGWERRRTFYSVEH